MTDLLFRMKHSIKYKCVYCCHSEDWNFKISTPRMRRSAFHRRCCVCRCISRIAIQESPIIVIYYHRRSIHFHILFYPTSYLLRVHSCSSGCQFLAISQTGRPRNTIYTTLCLVYHALITTLKLNTSSLIAARSTFCGRFMVFFFIVPETFVSASFACERAHIGFCKKYESA